LAFCYFDETPFGYDFGVKIQHKYEVYMLSDFVFTSKYAKFLGNLNRRETYEEAIERMVAMHEKKFQGTKIESSVFTELRNALNNKKIIGSQRALQFGGEAIEEKNWRIYNCTTSYCDRVRFFPEALWLLLCGSGTGFSVCKSHVDKLPALNKSTETCIFEVEDSIEGWADAVHALIKGYVGEGAVPFFDYSLIRPKGAKLRHGGKAPGHQGLELAINAIRDILEDACQSNTKKLRPIQCFDIMMHLADCVISGGIRRSSTICIFDAHDEEMLQAKVGDWYIKNPQRARANISAIILPSTPKEVYEKLFDCTKQWGEPGFLFLAHEDYCLNPCSEASMCPLLITDPNGCVVDNYTLDMLNNKEHYKELGYKYESGWQACNLTSINGAMIKTKDDFFDATRLATILGTFQTTYSNPGYLTEVSQRILQRENLLGVSITGMMMNREVLLNADIQKEAALIAVQTNRNYCEILGLKPSSRITLVKPEGTASLVLGSTSGIHPAHAPMYIRHVQSTDNDAPFLHFQKNNPQACSDSVWARGQKVIAFPMEFNSAIYAHEISAIELLEYSLMTQKNWVSFGTGRPTACEDLKHNVSITVSVAPHEWSAVKEYLWEHRTFFTGVAMLSTSGDYDYPQAPFVRVYSPDQIAENDPHREKKLEYWQLWNDLRASLVDVDYTEMVEYEDNTAFVQEAACAGGQCTVSF
jgi:ribonucleoside-triphosphate reductase